MFKRIFQALNNYPTPFLTFAIFKTFAQFPAENTGFFIQIFVTSLVHYKMLMEFCRNFAKFRKTVLDASDNDKFKMYLKKEVILKI